MTAENNAIGLTEEAEFNPQTYQPRNAKDAEKLLLLGATREELRRWFGVHEVFLDIWASEHGDFAKALQVEPMTLRIIEDFGLINWLKDCRLGNLDI